MLAMFKIILLLICSVLTFVFWGGIAWMPFVVFSLFIALRDRGSSALTDEKNDITNAPIGDIGRYEVDGEISYGLFILIENKKVFVDIKADTLKEKREVLAINILHNCGLIEKNIIKFKTNNPEFKNDYVNSFGLFSSDLNRVEVFWDSGRYSLMKNFQIFI